MRVTPAGTQCAVSYLIPATAPRGRWCWRGWGFAQGCPGNGRAHIGSQVFLVPAAVLFPLTQSFLQCYTSRKCNSLIAWKSHFGSESYCKRSQMLLLQPCELPVSGMWLAPLFPGWDVFSICFSAILWIERGSQVFHPSHIASYVVSQHREHPY